MMSMGFQNDEIIKPKVNILNLKGKKKKTEQDIRIEELEKEIKKIKKIIKSENK